MFDPTKLENGAYEIFWVSGGSSVASVGRTHTGKVWMAPSNWTSEDGKNLSVATTSYWDGVKKVRRLDRDTGVPLRDDHGRVVPVSDRSREQLLETVELRDAQIGRLRQALRDMEDYHDKRMVAERKARAKANARADKFAAGLKTMLEMDK